MMQPISKKTKRVKGRIVDISGVQIMKLKMTRTWKLEIEFKQYSNAYQNSGWVVYLYNEKMFLNNAKCPQL